MKNTNTLRCAEVRWSINARSGVGREKAYQLFTWPGDGCVKWPPATRAAVLRQMKALKRDGWYVIDATMALPQKW